MNWWMVIAIYLVGAWATCAILAVYTVQNIGEHSTIVDAEWWLATIALMLSTTIWPVALVVQLVFSIRRRTARKQP